MKRRAIPLAVRIGDVWVVTEAGFHLMYAMCPCMSDVGEPRFREHGKVAA